MSLSYPRNPTKGREIAPSSDLFNTASSGGGVWGGRTVQALGGGTCEGGLQPVESDNITFLLMPHRRPTWGIREGGYIFAVPHGNPSVARYYRAQDY